MNMKKIVDITSIADNISWKFSEKKTRVKVVPDDTYIASKLGVLWGNMGGDKYWY